LLPLTIWLFIARKKITKKQLFIFLGVLLMMVSTLILSEIKFDFKGINGLSHLFLRDDALVKDKTVFDFVNIYLDQMSKISLNTLFPTDNFSASLLTLLVLAVTLFSWKNNKAKKGYNWQPFILTFLFSHLPVVWLGGVSTKFIAVGLNAALIILTGMAIFYIWKNYKIPAVILLLLVLSSNIVKEFQIGKNGQINFAIQKDMLLSKEVSVIDYTYKSANGEKFSINTITCPFWVNSVWAYLYNWYGKSEYGYLPEWRGRDQVGQPGADILTKESADIKMFYLIKEPPQGIPDYQIEQAYKEEDARSKVVEERKFGDFVIQKRIKN
jgi:hypothetical protein